MKINLLKTCHPISLLPIFSETFQRIIYNSLFNHFQSNKLFTSSQSGFLIDDLLLSKYSQVYMKYKQHLITIQLLMWEVYFLTSQKLLILKSGIVTFHSSCMHMGLKVNYLPYLRITFIIVNKEQSDMVKYLSGEK